MNRRDEPVNLVRNVPQIRRVFCLALENKPRGKQINGLTQPRSKHSPVPAKRRKQVAKKNYFLVQIIVSPRKKGLACSKNLEAMMELFWHFILCP